MGLTAETGNYKRITSELAAGLETRKSPRDSRGDFRVSKTGEAFGIQWCRRGESNPRPRDYETLALPLSYAGWNQSIMLRTSHQRCQAKLDNFAKPAIENVTPKFVKLFPPHAARNDRDN